MSASDEEAGSQYDVDSRPLLPELQDVRRPDAKWSVLGIAAAAALLLVFLTRGGSTPAAMSSKDRLSAEWMRGSGWGEDEGGSYQRFEPGPTYDEGDDGYDGYSDRGRGHWDEDGQEMRDHGYFQGDFNEEEPEEREDTLRMPHLDAQSKEVVDAAIDAASEKASEGGMAAADQAALAGAEAAKKADGYGLDKKTVAKLAKIAASQAGLAAGMPVSAAKTAGMLAANNFEDPTPAPKPMPPRLQCRNAVDQYETDCLGDVNWIKNTGISQHPDWYPGLTAQSPMGAIQTAAKSKCKIDGCSTDAQIECLPNDCGCMDEAVTYYNTWIGKYPGGACKDMQMNVNGHCVCPPNMVVDGQNGCKVAEEPVSMTFYMYRAQSDYCYPMSNVNLGDLAGVMWYLHKEVVASVPRKYNVTRILRYLVTVKNPSETFEHKQYLFNGETHGKQFGPFGAFDNARCTATHCERELKEFGNAVGCQAVETGYYNYHKQAPVDYCDPPDSPECVAGTWYSLIGACPLESLYKKSDACKQQHPGAMCKDPDGTPHCTYAARYAGQVSLDELIGIQDYETWWKNEETGPTGNIEYEVNSDRGNGTGWWNERLSKSTCSNRMEQVLKLFKKRYPSLPEDLPDPPCA